MKSVFFIKKEVTVVLVLMLCLSSFKTVPSGKYKIGETAQGGIVFFVDKTGEHGLVCTSFDMVNIKWYSGIYSNVETLKDTIGSGKINTSVIIHNQILGNSTANYAAQLCDDLVVDMDGNKFDDWYLPSKYELNLIYMNLKAAGLGNFGDGSYWTSCGVGNFYAWRQSFYEGEQTIAQKEYLYKVRAVRAF